MKLKKVDAICGATGQYLLLDLKNQNDEITMQWLGDGNAFYPLEGLPVLNQENICSMFDISGKKLERVKLDRFDAPEKINWDNYDLSERELHEPDLRLRLGGADLMPLATSAGISFIDEKYLAPMDAPDYMRLYERRSKDGTVYIVVKVGLILQAVILPSVLPDDSLLNMLDILMQQCRHAMVLQTVKKNREGESNREPGPLFQVDEGTGEVLNEQEGQQP